MKRTSKILILVLSLALILGGVVMAISATASDVTVKLNATFEGSEVKEYTTTNPTIDRISFDQKGKTDGLEVVVGADGNKYVLLTQENAASGTPYMANNVGSYASKDGTKVASDISNYKYMIIEFDAMAPTGKFSPASLNPYFSYYKSSGSADFWRPDSADQVVTFGNDSNGSYVYPKFDNTKKFYINPYEFTRIQVVYETANTVVEGVELYDVKSHVYINGEFFFTKESTNAPKASAFSEGKPNVSFYRFWFNYGGAQDATLSLAIDNVKISTVPAGSDTAISDVLTYDAAEIPAGMPMAAIGSTEYLDVQSALNAANDGDTVTVLRKLFEAKTYTVNKPITVVAGDNNATFVPGADVYVTENNGTYTFEELSDMSYEYIANGVTVYADDTKPLIDVITAADAGTTIKLLRDIVNQQGSSRVNISKKITVDLNGRTATFEMYLNDSHKLEMFNINTTQEVRFKNGTLVAELVNSGTKNGKCFSLFTTTVANSKFFLENITSYSGQIYRSQTNGTVNFTIEGGTHYAIVPHTDLMGGYVESRGNMNFTANNAKFYLGSSGNGLLVSSSYKVSATADRSSVFTYNNCDIISETAGFNMIKSFNGHSKVYFNNCNVQGSINPSKHSFDSSSTNIVAGSIVFNDGCLINSETLHAAVALGSGCEYYTVSNSESYNFKVSTGNLYEGTFGTTAKTVNVTFTKGVYKIHDASIGDVRYTTVAEALEAAKAGDTVIVTRNSDTAAVYTVNKAITVIPGSYNSTFVAAEGFGVSVSNGAYTFVDVSGMAYEYVDKDSGITVYKDSSISLSTVIANAKAGTTVKLLADVDAGNKAVSVGKKLTLDLNGYTIKAMYEGASKASLFSMTAGTDLTVTSSRKGGKIFNEGFNKNSEGKATGVGANGVFTWSNNTAILHINGNGPDGTPYLAIYSGCIISAYGNASEYYIDGGMFVTVQGDMQGVLESRKAGRDAEVKNAIFYAQHGNGVFGYSGRLAALDNYGHVTVDNCKIIGDLTNASFVSPQTMTVTNTYITGKINVAINSTYKTVDGVANVPGTVTLGEGVYVGGDISDNVKIADGFTLYEEEVTKELTYDTHAWTVDLEKTTFDPSSFVVTSKNVSHKFTKRTVSEYSLPIATVGGVEYMDIRAALDAAVAGDTLTVLRNDLNATEYVVNKEITVIPGSYNATFVPAEKFTVTVTDGKYIFEKASYVATVGGVEYLTVAEALAAAKAGDTITIIANTESATEYTVDKAVTIIAGSYNSTFVPASGFTVTVTDGKYVFAEGKKIFEYTSGGKTVYGVEGDLLANIVSNADSGTTIKLLTDATYDQVANQRIGIGKKLTFDLNGKTLTVKMTYDKLEVFNITTTAEVRFKNGTIISEINTEAKAGKGFAFFTASTANSTLVLENITSYTAAIYRTQVNGKVNLTIEGGTHYSTTTQTDLMGGYIESRGNINFTANNATFYIGSTGNGLFGSSNYKVTDTASRSSVFNFNSCNIIAENSSVALVPYFNGHSTVKFNSCNIVGSISPTKHSFDSDSTAIADGTIIIGAGCQLDCAELSSAVTVASGYKLSSANAAATYSFKLNSGKLYTGDFALKAKAVSVIFSQRVIESTDKILTYTTSSGTTTVYEGEEINISTIISGTKSGGTITFYSDCTIAIAVPGVTIGKNITFDLNGHTVIFAQGHDGNANKFGRFSVSDNCTVNMENGTVIAQYNVEVSNKNSSTILKGKSYALFVVGGSSTINLENANTYTGMLVQNYSANNPKININGGVHYNIFPSTDCGTGFIESRNNITFTANNATFYIGGNGQGLLSSLHYNSSLAESALKSTFTFNNCKVIADNVARSIIPAANNFTFVYFNGCEIFGSILPAIGGSDSSSTKYSFSSMLPGSIKIGDGTKLAGNASFSSAVAVADGVKLTQIDRTAVVMKVRLLTGTVFEGTIAISGATEHEYYYTFEAAIPSEYTVTWYKEDGKTVIKTETIARGETVIPPTYTPGAAYNGWFKTGGYSGWTTTLGGTKVTNFTVNSDLNFYPASSGTVSAYLVGAQYNLTFLGDIKINLYIPVAPDGIAVNSVTVDGVTLYSTRVLIAGAEYDCYVIGGVNANKLTTAKIVSVNYTVGNTALTQKISLSAANYAKAILADSANAAPTHPTSAHTMVADMVRYSNSLTKYVSGSGDATLEALLSTYGSLCTTLPNTIVDESDISALTGYVKSATFDIGTMQPRYLFEFNTSATDKVIDCYVTMEGYLDKNVNGANYGTHTYRVSSAEYISGTKYLAKAYLENIPMYNFANTVTITILLENGLEKTGTYNLGAYYNRITLTESIEELLLSLKAFSDSAATYRYADYKITEEEAINFWTCSHSELVSVKLVAENAQIPVSAMTKYCNECKNYFIYYSDFGVIGDGSSDGRNADGSTNMTGNVTVSGTNDFAAIREAHLTANALAAQFPYKNIVIVGQGIKGNTFYMGYPDDGGTQAIRINTDVNWDGAHFIIDDTTVSNKAEYGTKTAYNQAIFELRGDETIHGKSITSNIPNGVAKGATNIGYAPGRTLMVKLTLKSVNHYIRYGANVNSGSSQTEMIVVDADGNIDPSTPVQWDYTNRDYCSTNVDKTISNSWVVTACTPVDADGDKKCDTCGKAITKAFSASIYSADDKPITINGLNANGEINFIWESITNTDVDVSGYDQVQRNIKVGRSNVTFQGFDRVFVEDNSAHKGKLDADKDGTPRQTYAAFVNVSYAYNVVMKDMLIDYHLGHNDENGVALGSYEFGGASSINISWINCIQKDFFRKRDNGDWIGYGGMFGSNFLRNVYINGCVMSSFDAHSGLYNATIENSTFDHINFVGGGDAILRNVVVYAEADAGICHLRSDYGSMWQGNIKIDGATLRHDSDFSGTMQLIKAYYTNHYFGFDTEMPANIYINNFSVKQYNRTSEAFTHNNGVVYEDEKTSSKSVYLFYTLNSQLKNDYDYSTINANNKDPKACTENVYITNTSATIIFPDHPFFENMKVYKDGVLQDWFTVRSGLHTDKDGNKACDTCGYKITCSETHPTSGSSTTTCSTCKTTIRKSSTCVTPDTLITLADGTQKEIQYVTLGENVLAWNFYTGEYEIVPVSLIQSHETGVMNVLYLYFEDGSVLKVLGEHGIFDADLNTFIFIDEFDADEYVGHSFVKQDGDGFATVKLVGYEVISEYTTAYTILSLDHYNVIAEGMFTVTPAHVGENFFNPFEIGEDMKYDDEAVKADVEKYGLYTYEDFAHVVTEEQFDALNLGHFKVSVGKGYITYEGLIYLIENFINNEDYNSHYYTL